MEEKRVQELAAKAVKVRRTALEAIEAAHSGHVGGSFSVADILTVLYWEKTRSSLKIPTETDLYCQKVIVHRLCTRHWHFVDSSRQKI